VVRVRAALSRGACPATPAAAARPPQPNGQVGDRDTAVRKAGRAAQQCRGAQGRPGCASIVRARHYSAPAGSETRNLEQIGSIIELLIDPEATHWLKEQDPFYSPGNGHSGR